MFKKGDKVRCLVRRYHNETVGKIYEVREDEHIEKTYDGVKTAWFGVVVDDQGQENSYHPEDFELVKEANMKIGYHVLNDSIVLSYGGKLVTVSREDSRYDAVLACIRENRLQDIPEAVEIERKYDGDGIKLQDGLIVAGGETLPAELESRILKFKEQKLPYDSLLKFWDNLKKNPSYNARKMLFKFLEHNGHPLTTDGCFIAYRGVTEDFKDPHTKKFDNKPGSVCEMPREAVDDNPNNTCSPGLHVACFEYAKGFGQRLVEVKVNPTDVVCVPVDYKGTKMRTCRFEVIQECFEMNEEVLKDLTDDEYLDTEDPCDHQCGICVNSEHDGYQNEEKDYRHAVRGPNGRFVKST